MTAQKLPDKNLYSVTEAAQLLGVSPTTLRRWEKEDRLTPLRTPGGDRRYSPQVIQKVLTSFRQETDQRRDQPDAPTPPPPLTPIRTIEDYQPRKYPLRRLAVLAIAVLIGGYFLFDTLPPLTRERLQRAFTPGPLNPIVDVNDIAEYKTKESGEFRLGIKFPLEIDSVFTKSLGVLESAVLNTSRFFGTIFFGKTKDYYITPIGNASLKNISAKGLSINSIEAGILSTKALTITSPGVVTGLNADLLDNQEGTYYLDWENFGNKPTILSSLNEVSNHESNIDLVEGSNITITPDDAANTITISTTGGGTGGDANTLDGLDSPQFLRSDTSDSFTSGTLTFNAGTTLNLSLATFTLAANQIDESRIAGEIEAVSAGSGLTGGGTSGSISLSHENTSSQASLDNSNGVVIQDITLDGFGHVSALETVDLDARYYTQALLDGGQLDSRYYTETELDSGQLDTRYYTETETDTLLGTQDELSELGDVSITLAQAGDYLRFSGASWVDVTISQVLTDLNTVDGAGSGLDADLLDNQHGAYYLDSANFTGVNWTDLTDAGETSLHIHDHGVLNGLGDDDHPQYSGIAQSETITGLWTFDRDPGAPFAVSAGSAVVTNLDTDLLDGQTGTYYLDLDNETGTCTNCLTTTEINESTFTGLNASNIDNIYLFNDGDTAAGDYNFDSNTLVIDSATHRVGIGTPAPSFKTHILGAGGFGGGTAGSSLLMVETNTGGNTAAALSFKTDSGSTIEIMKLSGASTPAHALYIDNRNAAPIVLLTSDTERLKAADSEVVVNDPSNDIDFRVESNASQHMLFVDGGANEVLMDASNTLSTADGTLHVHTATAGAVIPSAYYNDLVVENSDHGGISILTPTAAYGGLIFGSPSDEDAGWVKYLHSTNELIFGTSSGDRAKLTSSAFEFEVGTISMIDQAVDVTLNNAVDALNFDSNTLSIDALNNRIGIGTPNPGYELDVSGGINFTGSLREDGVEIFSGMIAPFAGNCPTGWTEYTAAQGRTVIGVPDGGSVAGTVGTPLTNLGTRTITDVPSHRHSITAYDLGTTTATLSHLKNNSGASTQYTNYTGSASVDVTMPYIQLRYCQKSAGSDFAEWIPSDEYLQPESVVSIDPYNDEKVVSSKNEYDSSVVGIIATEPGWLIGDENEESVQMALSGRVPTKVSIKNGFIKRGDPITTSTIPGVGMLATKGGPIVGKAMEALDETSSLTPCFDESTGKWESCGTIKIFVNISWYDPETDQDSLSTQIAQSDYTDDLLMIYDTVKEGDVVDFNYHWAPASQGDSTLQRKGEIRKTTGIHDPLLAGVISNSKGELLRRTRINHITLEEIRLVTQGIAEVKISPESKDIKEGDPVTSFEEGKAVKAVRAGTILGRALENWSPETGRDKIKVYVNPSWYNPAVLVDSDGDVAQSDPDGSTTKIVAQTVEAKEGIFERLTVTILGTFEKLVTKTAEIASAVIKKLTVESLAVKGESIGQVVIETGEIELTVGYPDLKETSKVFFTLNRPVAVGVEKTPGEGFKFILADPSDLLVTIDYWIVE